MKKNPKIAIVKPAAMTYEGRVSMWLVDKGGHKKPVGTVKNSGTRILFQLLCRVLLGMENTQSIKNQIPNYLAIGNAANPTATDDMFTTTLNQEIDIGTRIECSGKSGPVIDRTAGDYSIRARFAFSIPHSTIGDRTITELGLCSSGTVYANTVMARVVTTEENESGNQVGISIPQGQSLLISWELAFRNR